MKKHRKYRQKLKKGRADPAGSLKELMDSERNPDPELVSYLKWKIQQRLSQPSKGTQRVNG